MIISIEPALQPLNGENFSYRTANVDDGAHGDLRARGFWTAHQDAFFDIRVFYPNASSYRSASLSSIYHRRESSKKREYCEHVREVKHGVFTPLVLSFSGCMAHEAIVFYKRLLSM